MNLPEWCQTHTLKEFFELVNQKESPMNTEQNIRDPNAILITDEEMAKLLATKPEGAEVGYISTDDADEEPVH